MAEYADDSDLPGVTWILSQDAFINEKDGISRARKRRQEAEAARRKSGERPASGDVSGADSRTPRDGNRR